jgi:hypothetical protein
MPNFALRKEYVYFFPHLQTSASSALCHDSVFVSAFRHQHALEQLHPRPEVFPSVTMPTDDEGLQLWNVAPHTLYLRVLQPPDQASNYWGYIL